MKPTPVVTVLSLCVNRVATTLWHDPENRLLNTRQFNDITRIESHGTEQAAGSAISSPSMKTTSITALVLTTGLFTAGGFAETAPATPTPALAATEAGPAAVAPVVPVPDQIVYAARLPGVEDLTNVAAAQGLAINQIIQTARHITVSYQLANGRTRTVSYQLLPTGDAASAQVVAQAPAPVQVIAQAPAPVVVVAPAPDVYYYDPYYYGAWYPPIAVRIGADFGFRGRWR